MSNKKKFKRISSHRWSKLGKRRKKKVKWKKPTGRDNSIRERIRGKPSAVSVGFKASRKESGRINGMAPVRVNSISDLEKMKKGEIAVIGKMGMKKKLEIAKKMKEKGITSSNLNSEKLLKKTKRKTKEKK